MTSAASFAVSSAGTAGAVAPLISVPAGASSPRLLARRLEYDDRRDDDDHRAERDPDPQAGVAAVLHHGGGDQQRDQVHDLDQRVDRGAGGVLERVAHGVADDGRLVRGRALAAVVAVLDQLLGVVPGAAGVGQEHRHQHARRDRARPGTSRAARSRSVNPTAIGVSTASRPGVTSSRSESAVTMSTTRE